MTAPSVRFINSLYLLGLLCLIVKSDETTTEVSKFNETKIVQNSVESSTKLNHGFESTTAIGISPTTEKSPISITEATRNELASTMNGSFITHEADYYDEDVIEMTSTTQTIRIENSTIESSNISTATVTTTQMYKNTTEITTSTTVEAPGEAISIENATTTTITPTPKNETESATNSTEPNGILNAEIVSDLYTYYTMITPIILRIIFGITVSVAKVKDALKRPTGIIITLFCNFFYMPLVSASNSV